MNAISAGRTRDLIEALTPDVLPSLLPNFRDQSSALRAALECGT